MSATRWSDALLDAKRMRGDQEADAVIENLFADGDIAAVNGLMRTLVMNDGLPAEQLPVAVREYLARTSATPELDPKLVEGGEDVFGLYGPEILAILGFYSLPAAYAARKGVQVLYRTAYLEKRPVRRVFETTQMVVDVMAADGLAPHGKGVRTAEKVRLMHAAVRHLIRSDPQNPWDVTELGVPINQEDLAGTLMTFSYVVIEGLGRLGIDLTREQQEAYLHAWSAVGRLMGVDEDLIPRDVADAEALTLTIRRRQVAASPEGTALTQALLEGMDSLFPRIVHGLSASMVDFFLDSDAFMKQDVAAMLGVPRANWTWLLVRGFVLTAKILGKVSQLDVKLFRFFSRRFVSGLLLVERGGTRPPFAIPQQLADLWRT